MGTKGFSRDQSGLFHFRWEVTGTTVEDAAIEAIRNRPKGPAWFWFNDTPTPIYSDDSPDTLVERWRQWRVATKQCCGNELMRLLEQLAGR